jgi:two-component system, LytTR family, response regulator
VQINCIVIEDEPLASKKLIAFINKVGYLELCKSFDNAIDAISYVKEKSIDLIFLDIQMEEFTGIQFLETVKERPKVIITTAYEKYALKSYEFDVIDYLLKPFTFDRFLQSVEKVYKSSNNELTSKSNNCIFVKTEYRLEKIEIDEILFIEGMSEYLGIVTTQKRIMTLQNFSAITKILPNDNFFRVHKSYLVAIDKIKSIERNRIRIGDKIIPISDTYKDAFYSKLKDKNIII